jgi:N-acetylmuramoyl-L-alanine amidase
MAKKAKKVNKPTKNVEIKEKIEYNEKPLWILDNGHGEDTPGKRSPIWEDGSQLMEYEFNRAIVKRLAARLDATDMDYHVLVPELEDISLQERVRRINELSKNRNCILVSIHANAGGGSGFEVFTYPGESYSDTVATTFYEKFKITFPHQVMRSDNTDGDVDKEATFYILKCACPAVLVESFFMDTLNPDCKILMSEDGRDRITEAYFRAIESTEENL